MFFKQYELGCLSILSYLIGDTTTGQAVVVDPQRDISQYLADAEANGLTIVKVVETHFHADFLSGHLELAEATGADVVFGRFAADKAEFPIEPMGDGDRITLGEVELAILETPGHTPESISIVVYERRADEVPYGVLTGDTLFIGDVGRPDLLAAIGFTADELARMLYSSLHDKLLTLPDATRVFPAHSAGSACGKNLSTETVSTIGEQRRVNYALQPMGLEQFVEAVTQGQAAAPMYFLFAAITNRKQHDTFSEEDVIPALTLDEVLAHQAAGGVVVDTRDEADFAAAHLEGSLNVGLGGRFAEYTGEIVPAGTPIALVCEPEHEHEAKIRLARIGFDDVVGYLARPLAAFVSRPELVGKGSRLSVVEFAERRREVERLQVVDVRGPGEVALGVIPGAVVVQLPSLLARIDQLDKDVPTVVYSAGGYRSSIAASTLRAHGFTDVSDLLGGFTAWTAAGLDATRPQEAGR